MTTTNKFLNEHIKIIPVTMPTAKRPLHEIAFEIHTLWAKPYFGAVPYLEAMAVLSDITDRYYSDDAKSMVIYFLSNATSWRGPDARRIKAELKALAGVK